MKYSFDAWDDGNRDNPRTVNVISDMAMKALYKEVISTGQLSGAVSVEEAPGEPVGIEITEPDGTVTTLQAVTDASGAFSVQYTPPSPGDYYAVAKIGEDLLYQAAQSPPVSFSVKFPRTITLGWTA